MPRPQSTRRTLALRVRERHASGTIAVDSPGQRFANGWALFGSHGQFGEGGLAAICGSDPITTAGFLAAKAAWDAHHYAVNWIEVAPAAPAEGCGA